MTPREPTEWKDHSRVALSCNTPGKWIAIDGRGNFLSDADTGHLRLFESQEEAKAALQEGGWAK